MRAANAVPELRRRLLPDGQVVEYDHCDPSYTVMKPDGTGVYVYCLLEDDLSSYEKFVAEGKRRQKETLERGTLTEDGDVLANFFVSCVPWLYYTQIKEPAGGADDSNPRFAWGKYREENGRMMHYTTPYHTLQTLIGQYNQCHPDAPLPMIPFHGLRHTSATLLISAHQDVKTVSARLGHAQNLHHHGHFIPMPCGKMTARRRIPWSRCWDENPASIWMAPKVRIPINNRPSQNCHTDRRGTIPRWYLFCLFIPIDRMIPANPAVPDAPGTILPHRNTPELLSGQWPCSSSAKDFQQHPGHALTAQGGNPQPWTHPYCVFALLGE